MPLKKQRVSGKGGKQKVASTPAPKKESKK